MLNAELTTDRATFNKQSLSIYTLVLFINITKISEFSSVGKSRDDITYVAEK